MGLSRRDHPCGRRNTFACRRRRNACAPAVRMPADDGVGANDSTRQRGVITVDERQFSGCREILVAGRLCGLHGEPVGVGSRFASTSPISANTTGFMDSKRSIGNCWKPTASTTTSAMCFENSGKDAESPTAGVARATRFFQNKTGAEAPAYRPMVAPRPPVEIGNPSTPRPKIGFKHNSPHTSAAA